MNEPRTPSPELDDPTVPKHFEAEIVLSCRLEERPAPDVRVRRGVIAGTWAEARRHLAALPLEDLVDDEREVLEIEITMTGWRVLAS